MNKKEALAALAAGKKVRSENWMPTNYAQISPGGSIVMVSTTRAGQQVVSPFDWNNASGDKWAIVIDERDELAEALGAVKDARRCYNAPFDSILFAKIERYLNRRARELGPKVPE